MRLARAMALVFALLLFGGTVYAYSVLTHEEIIDLDHRDSAAAD